ncbi:hypothetical protein LTR56_014637 [Elasticomyces elasticus]|nr:hypothetical protein LTR56_014637 [Elasticomyces elasticus]KAK3645314.1 hypothetical protein LTR22_014779 [Elasticomyces elasticus]KAK4919844.1 hypothetical protein LTR49_012591 [Elasticomyces elasticus]KAK5752893.1 hypothetical protein LTS12_017064 [Elasticomyces elasticus]
MASPPPFRFFALPAELRDLIYEYCLINATLPSLRKCDEVPSDRRGDLCAVSLSGTTSLPLMLVCKRFRDEYQKRAVSSSTKLCYYVGSGPKIHGLSEDLGSRPKLPFAFLKTVKRCSIQVNWMELGTPEVPTPPSWLDTLSRVFSFGRPQVQVEPQTPTEALCDAIRAHLAQLRNILHPEATIRVGFHIWGLPKMHALVAGYPSVELGRLAESKMQIFDASTFTALPQHPALQWPAGGNLDMTCVMVTALSCPMRSSKAQLSGELDAGGPEGRVPEDAVYWTLTPTKDHNNWRGFMPTVYAIKHAGVWTRVERVP